MHHKNWRNSTTKLHEVMAVARGPYWLVTLSGDEDLAPAFTGCTVEILGNVYKYPMAALPPVFGDVFDPNSSGWVIFEACRITHREVPGEVRVHWHDEWERITSLHQDAWKGPQEEPQDIDLRLLQIARQLFKSQDRRGKKDRFEVHEVERAIQKIQARGDKEITAELIAANLGRSTKGFEKWLKVEGYTVETLCYVAALYAGIAKRRVEEQARRLNSVKN
jgi:hypothetical protein